MIQFILKAYPIVNQIILIVGNDFDCEKLESFKFLKIIQLDFDSPWSKASESIKYLNNNLILLTPDDDYFLYEQIDIVNFNNGGFDYSCLNYAMVKKSNLIVDNIHAYELFNGWIHHKLAANNLDINLRIEEFVDQGVATFWGLYSYEHFVSTMTFAAYASNLFSKINYNFVQIIEDCLNIINLASKLYCSSNSWCLRMLDRKSTKKTGWLSSAEIFKIISLNFNESKNELITSMKNIVNDMTSLNYSNENINYLLSRHVDGYIAANSRIWRCGLIIYYIPTNLNKNSARRVMLNNDNDDIRIFIFGDLLSDLDVALKYSWVNQSGFRNLFNLIGPEAILKHDF